jgi:NAD dependent epimerase/dehydratase family enzyme
MPWVHLDDVAGLLLHAARDERLRGPMNVVSPEPVTNAEFTRELGHALGRPAVLSVPRLALKVAFGELSQALLASQRVLPGVAAETNYPFAHPRLGPALVACVKG